MGDESTGLPGAPSSAPAPADADPAAQAAEARLASALDGRLAEHRLLSERRVEDLRAEIAERIAAFEVHIDQGLRSMRRFTLATCGVVLAAAGALALAAVGRPMLPAHGQSLGVVADHMLVDLLMRPTLPFVPPNLPRAGAARAPPGAGAGAYVPPGQGAASEDIEALAQAISRGDRAALHRAEERAQAGSPNAQLLLAKVYEEGRGGLPRDLAVARRWTARAAEAGEPAAMHNLAVYMVRGEGGSADLIGAARWFERAAWAGVIDAQFNLGLLNESGRGVQKNLGEAYRWYSIAANAGDALARARAVVLEARLTATERARAAAAILRFRPGRVEGMAETAPPVLPSAATVAESQQLLAREGYFIGPTDGSDSPAYRTAAATYLRDHPQAQRVVLSP